MNNSRKVADVPLELKLKKTSREKYEGTIGSFKRMDKRLIPEQSVRKGFRASGIDHHSEGGSWHDTKPSVRNNLKHRGYGSVRFRSCGTMGYGPTMWVKVGRWWRLTRSCKRGMSEDSSSVMSATTSIPRARDEENHFPARWTRQANRQGSRPSVATGMSSTIVTGSYW